MNKEKENKGLWNIIKKDFAMVIIGVIMLLITVMSASASEITSISASNIDVIRGNITQGDVTNTYFPDDSPMIIQELNVDDSLRVNVVFNTNTYYCEAYYSRIRYRGGAGHEVYLEIYKPLTEEWYLIDTYTNSVNYHIKNYDLTSYNITCNEITLRYRHGEGGLESHFLDLDYVALGVILISEEDDDDDDSKGLLVMDLSDTLNIIILSLFLVVGVVLSLLVSAFIGGLILFFTGIVLLINAYLFFGFALIIFGVWLFFVEEDKK